MRTRLFHSIVGVAVALAPSACEDSQLTARVVDASLDDAASDSVMIDTAIDDTAVLDTEAVDSAETMAPADTADAAETYTDAPTDADASDGWAPTK